MRLSLKSEIFPLSLIFLFVLVSIYAYDKLPDPVPSHFDIHGNPDHYMPKFKYFLFLFGVFVGLYIILTFIPLIDPFWKKIQPKYKFFLIIRDFVLVFFLYFFIIALIAGKKGQLELLNLGIGFGFLFILIGNYLPKLPRNFFFGIRTPWTLSSEEIWEKTHILGGWVFVLAGIVMIILSLLKLRLELIIFPAIVIVAILPTFYSLFLHLKQKNKKEPDFDTK